MFNTYTLEDDIKRLQYIAEHSSSKSLKSYYNRILIQLSSILYELTEEYPEIRITKRNMIFMEKYANNLEKVIKEQVSSKEYTDLVNTLTRNSLKRLKPIIGVYPFKTTINLSDAKDLIKDFICSYDISLYPIIEKALSDEHLFTINNISRIGRGYSYFNTYSRNPYIIVYTENNKLNMESLICLVHELGHVIHFYTTGNRPKNYDRILVDNFIETPSLTFEYFFIDYLIKNDIEFSDTQKILNNNLHMLKEYLQYLRVNNQIVDLIVDKDEYEEEELQQMLLSRGTALDIELIHDYFYKIQSNYEFSLGGLLAAYYYEQYRKDPEKTKKDFYDFSKCIGVTDNLDMINNFGINFEKFKQCMYLKDIVDENQKHLQYKR